jgi:sugar lactone lactonase YvrE
MRSQYLFHVQRIARQKVNIAVFKIDLNYTSKPFINDLMNATAMAFDRQGILYISSTFRRRGYQVTSLGSVGLRGRHGRGHRPAFDEEENLYVGDRSGTIFKIAPNRQILFSPRSKHRFPRTICLDPAVSVAFRPRRPASIPSIALHLGEVEVFYKGLGRPQGMAFDAEHRLYVAASLSGRKGIIRLTPDRQPELFVSGPGIVGMAFTPSKSLIVATTNSLYRVDAGIKGRLLTA